MKTCQISICSSELIFAYGGGGETTKRQNQPQNYSSLSRSSILEVSLDHKQGSCLPSTIQYNLTPEACLSLQRELQRPRNKYVALALPAPRAPLHFKSSLINYLSLCHHKLLTFSRKFTTCLLGFCFLNNYYSSRTILEVMRQGWK